MKKPVVALSVVLVAAVAFGLTALEVRHHLKYGHFLPLGLHADVTDFQSDNGLVPKTFFDAHLTNFGWYPQEIERCEFGSDANAHEESVAYRLEQLDNATHGWKTLFDNGQTFCGPYVPGIAQSKLIKKVLWTGQSLSTGGEATAERAIPTSETMRFVIEANGREFPTMPFNVIQVYGH